MTREEDLAFPVKNANYYYDGLTKLEYFSLHILQGMLSGDKDNVPMLAEKMAVESAKILMDELNRAS